LEVLYLVPSIRSLMKRIVAVVSIRNYQLLVILQNFGRGTEVTPARCFQMTNLGMDNLEPLLRMKMLVVKMTVSNRRPIILTDCVLWRILDGLRTRNFVQVIVRQMVAICCCMT
jgi:hypothetical protein